jgi:CheY-like chemotaxis protein
MANDASAGLTLARSFHPEVVICDLGLPTMDGYSFARAVRAEVELRGMFLVALSGYAQPADVQRAISSGFDVHVAKPPSFEKLDRLLSQAHA